MAVRYICDRCGETDQVGRFTVSLAVSTPHTTTNLPKFNGELCDVCMMEMCGLIRDALATKRR